MQMLRNYFAQFGSLSEPNMELLVNCCTAGTLEKGQSLIRVNDMVDCIYFLEEGYLHHFSYNEMGDRVTLKIVCPNYFWTMTDCFFGQYRTKDECVALTNVRYRKIKRSKYDALKLENQELSAFIHTVTEQILSAKVIEVNNKSKMSVEQRYLELLETQPEMVREVPVAIIASYIGTSRETLHRIRKKLAAA